MTTLLTVRATEGSTYVVSVSFTDEDGDPVVPTSVKWTLTDDEGAIVNAREDVVETPASTIEVALSGDDLPSPGDQTRSLYFTVEVIYDSALGIGLHLRGQCRIDVLPLEAFV